MGCDTRCGAGPGGAIMPGQPEGVGMAAGIGGMAAGGGFQEQRLGGAAAGGQFHAASSLQMQMGEQGYGPPR